MNTEKRVIWRKSSHSTQEGGQCVELAGLDIDIAVRDSTDPTGPVLQFDRPVIAKIVERIKAGELDR